MIILCLKDTQQITFLECALLDAGIDYKIEEDNGRYGIPPPYLIVYGAPIGEKQAFKWISQQNH